MQDMMIIKEVLRKIIRAVIGAKKNENINDAIERKLIQIEKRFYKSRYSTNMLKAALENCEISNGDILFVHCSWRNMYNYDGGPEDVIEMLKALVGQSGTILMPSYGADRKWFDVAETPSNAGVLSEVFRQQMGVLRSACTHFSVAGTGRNAEDILEGHIRSQYGFDQYSPLFKLGEYANSKVLFLGLGSEPTKISIFHCAGAFLREHNAKLKKLLSYEYESVLVLNGNPQKKKMYIRLPGHKNDNKVFRKIFRSIKNRKRAKISNLDVVVINAREAIQQAILYAENGIYCYKRMDQI